MMKIGRFFQLVALILIAAGAQPVSSAVYQWSTTAANNATADPNINWSEGQSPSSINDSARAMMQQIQLWRKDTNGSSLQTAGGPTAYTITSNEGFSSTSAMNGAVLTFYISGTTNGPNPTLNVDGLGASPIVTAIGSPVPAGAMNILGQYTAAFSNSTNSWVLQNYYANSFNIPLGAYLESSASSPPNANFLAADGSCISRTTYAAYFALVSTTYGGCDGSTTFALPDRRGRVAAMLDGGAGRLTNSANGCGTTFNSLGVTCGNESQTLTLAQIPTGITSAGGALAVTGATTVNLLYNGNLAQNLLSGTNGFGWSNSPTVGTAPISGNTAAQAVTSNNTSGTAHPNVQATFGVNIFVRVL